MTTDLGPKKVFIVRLIDMANSISEQKAFDNGEQANACVRFLEAHKLLSLCESAEGFEYVREECLKDNNIDAWAVLCQHNKDKTPDKRAQHLESLQLYHRQVSNILSSVNRKNEIPAFKVSSYVVHYAESPNNFTI